MFVVFYGLDTLSFPGRLHQLVGCMHLFSARDTRCLFLFVFSSVRAAFALAKCSFEGFYDVVLHSLNASKDTLSAVPTSPEACLINVTKHS
jgi:hypothetical protein